LGTPAVATAGARPARANPRAQATTPSAALDALAGRRIVFVNWRDLAHPRSGGAELYCQSVAERFAAAGARVTLVTAQPGDLPALEWVRGVAVRRAGGTFGVYAEALRWLRSHRREVDAVVDCQNGIPFFSPLALSRATPIVQVLHHVHQRQFPLYFPGPAAKVGQVLEADGSRRVYGRRPVAVVSPSSRDEAREVLGLAGPRYLVPNGVTPPGQEWAKATVPTIVCVGRLVPHKRMHLLLDAVARLRHQVPGLVVHVVGDGPDRDRLAAHARDLGLGEPPAPGGGPAATGVGGGATGATGIVRWHGFLDATERDRLLSRAWLTVNPSHGEGWGLSVVEAAAHGTPAVAFRVPGLRDAVRDGETGWLVNEGTPLASAIGLALAELADPVLAVGWRDRARAWARSFSWDATAELLAAIVVCESDRLARGGPDRRLRDDPVTLATFATGPGSPLPSLRRTDLLYRDSAGNGVALLYGASQAQARAALRRAGIDGPVQTATATGADLLAGTGASVSHRVAR
jgi:glycosyltransferase involved in cell wall biosynthesis